MKHLRCDSNCKPGHRTAFRYLIPTSGFSWWRPPAATDKDHPWAVHPLAPSDACWGHASAQARLGACLQGHKVLVLNKLCSVGENRQSINNDMHEVLLGSAREIRHQHEGMEGARQLC